MIKKNMLERLGVIAALLLVFGNQGVLAAISNTASTTYRDTLGGNYSGTSNTAVVNVITAPNITLVKSANPVSVAPGATVTFSITYTNTGGTANNVLITDTIPANSTFVAGSITQPTGVTSAVSGGVITWTVGTVNAGATGTVTFRVTAD